MQANFVIDMAFSFMTEIQAWIEREGKSDFLKVAVSSHDLDSIQANWDSAWRKTAERPPGKWKIHATRGNLMAGPHN